MKVKCAVWCYYDDDVSQCGVLGRDTSNVMLECCGDMVRHSVVMF